MADWAILNSTGRLAVLDADSSQVWGPMSVFGDGGLGLVEMRRAAETMLARAGWRKAGRWSHSAKDPQHEWVSVERHDYE